jgi:hypothetical protein
MVASGRRFWGTMKSLLAAAARLLRLLVEMEARTALRPVVVPVRK